MNIKIKINNTIVLSDFCTVTLSNTSCIIAPTFFLKSVQHFITGLTTPFCWAFGSIARSASWNISQLLMNSGARKLRFIFIDNRIQSSYIQCQLTICTSDSCESGWTFTFSVIWQICVFYSASTAIFTIVRWAWLKLSCRGYSNQIKILKISLWNLCVFNYGLKRF